jgi:hypothetical protein
MQQMSTIQLADFCRLFAVDDRPVRYILEGFVPKGVDHSPNTGNRREFGPGHADWLAILLKLKQSGLKTALAAEVANFANQAIRAATNNLNWDPRFSPATGGFDRQHQYYLAIGDFDYLQLVPMLITAKTASMNAAGGPSRGERRRLSRSGRLSFLRVDLARIAQVLAQVVWSGPEGR